VLSLAVEVFILPLQLYHFHTLSTVGPIATVIFFLPVTVVLLAAVPVALTVPLAPAAEWPGRALGWFSLITTRAILACGHLTPGPFALPQPNPWLYYTALLLAWKWRRQRRVLVAAAAVVVVSFLWR
jgi:hypothetical protein